MTTFRPGTNGSTLHSVTSAVPKNFYGGWRQTQTETSYWTYSDLIDDTKDIDCNVCGQPVAGHAHHSFGHCAYEQG